MNEHVADETREAGLDGGTDLFFTRARSVRVLRGEVNSAQRLFGARVSRRCRGARCDERRYTRSVHAFPARILLTVSCAVLAACGVRVPAVAPSPRNTPALAPPPTTVLPRTVVTPDSATSADELLARGLSSADCHASQEYFERAYTLDPNGPLAEEALYRWADALDACAALEPALDRYEQVVRRFPDGRFARPSLVRSVRLLAHLERWERAGANAESILEKYTDLLPLEHVVALSGRALALVAKGDDEHAEYYVEKSRSIVEEHGLDAADKIPRDVAMTYYALGEIRRLRAERIKFVPRPPDFGVQLERRCQFLLDAQSAYSNAMRAYDAHWSAMSGFRVGALYQSLHTDLMDLVEHAPPAAADTPARHQLLEGAMRLRYSILLTKARAMMEHTLAMAARTGEKSEWVLKAEQADVELGRSIAAEDASIARLPYTRAELQSALDDLAQQHAP